MSLYALPKHFLASAIVAAGLFTAGCTFVKNDNLNQAARAGDRARCQALLRKGAHVNGVGINDMKPIMSGARGGNLETVRYLVSKGADVNAHNDSGSALMWAVDSGNEELVRYLLVSGADAGWTNALGNTVVDFARRKGATNMIPILEKQALKAESDGAANRSQPFRSETNRTSGTADFGR